ncbi:Single-stranded DNA-binding protein [hydrothermal vent metagenome]|uniref:Single-stranded DNA-binding protein n=1 Tax=hydrothermal vent metagenome TaxID=652676 RepID=A0A1W1EHW5_9ZZZZ
MYNKVVLVGNLTRDIEVRYTQSGSAIANTAIATSRKFKSQSGEQKEEVMFIDITFFGRTAEVANQYLKRGSKVLVDGRLKFDQWVAQDGTKRNKHSVIVESMQMLGSKDENMNASGNIGYNNQYNQQSQNSNNNNYSNNQNSSYAQPSQNNSYSNNQNSNYEQQRQAPVTNNQPQETPKIPEIDISEDEIPF